MKSKSLRRNKRTVQDKPLRPTRTFKAKPQGPRKSRKGPTNTPEKNLKLKKGTIKINKKSLEGLSAGKRRLRAKTTIGPKKTPSVALAGRVALERCAALLYRGVLFEGEFLHYGV